MRRVDVHSRPLTGGQEPLARLRRIVVALDGTPFAEAALPTAVALGRAYNAEVVLVRAHTARAEPVRTRLGLRRHERETLARASLYLARIEQELLADGVRAFSISPVGRAADAIADVASQDCDLVVIATHAAVGLARSAQVSVARELATRSEVPMLMVSPSAKGLLTPNTGTPTFVVALDGERRDAIALRLVTSLVGSFGGHVMALCSTSNPGWRRESAAELEQASPARVEARVTNYLETVRNDLAERDVAAWTAIVDGDLPTEVARLPRAENEVIVLGSHGTLARREAAADAAMTLVRATGAAVLLVPQEPLLTLLPGGLPSSSREGGAQ